MEREGAGNEKKKQLMKGQSKSERSEKKIGKKKGKKQNKEFQKRETLSFRPGMG